MKKWVSILMVAALLMSSAVALAEDVTLTFAASQNWVNKGSDVDNELIAKFEEETGIKIDLQVIPDDQYVNVLKTKLATGEVPDIFYVSGGVGAEKFMPEKYFADLSNEAWVSRYMEYAKQGTTIDGKVLGFMTWNVDGWGIVYNKKLYDELNLSVPKTFEEFCTVADALLAKGITPIYECGKDAWHWGIYLSSYGPYAASKHEGLYDQLNTNTIKFADIPEFVDFLNDMKTAYDKGYFGENSLANAWDASYEALGTGAAAGFLGYQSYQGEVQEKYPDAGVEQWEMYPIPMGDNTFYSHSAGGNMRVAYKDSPNLPYVKQFFDFLAREDNLKTFYEKATHIAANPSFVDVAPKTTVAGETIIKNTSGQGMEMEYGVLYWDNTLVGTYIQELLLGAKTAEQVLEAIDSDRQKLFEAISE